MKRLLGVVMVTMAACSSEPTSPAQEPIDLLLPSTTVMQVEMGGDSAVSLRGYDIVGTEVPIVAASWSSTNPAVASVTPRGLVEGRAMGSADVRAVVLAETATVHVVVVGPIVDILINSLGDSMRTGETVTLYANGRDANRTMNVIRRPVLTVADTTRAVLVQRTDGGVDVLGVRPGTARITATLGGRRASVDVRVIPKVFSVNIAPDSIRAVAGTQHQLTATVRDSTGAPISGRVVLWSVQGQPGQLLTAQRVLTIAAAGTGRLIAQSEGRADTIATTGLIDAAPEAIAAGDQTTCIVTSTGTTWCWGSSLYGQFGDGAEPHHSPTAMRGIAPPLQTVTMEIDHVCGLDAAGSAWCWGIGAFGQLGNPAGMGGIFCPYGAPCRSQPMAVLDSARYVRLATGRPHTCGITAAGVAWCWGNNRVGSLGIGSTDTLPHPQPLRVAGNKVFTDIAAGEAHTCALDQAGAAWCWGYNAVGELGNGSVGGQFDPGTPVPTAVSGGQQFTAIEAFRFLTCGLTAAGAAWCWGENFGPTPTLIGGGHAFRQVVVGPYHACGIDADSTAWCWGDNEFGQLGNGGNANSPVPVPVSGGFKFRVLAAGAFHSCGIVTDRRVVCWGEGSLGELGVYPVTSSYVPVVSAGYP